MESLLRIAEELERRDDDAAAALAEVERLEAAVQELRERAAAVASFLARLPGAVAARQGDVKAAEAARLDAETRLREAEAAQERAEEAEKEAERLAAARAVQQESDRLREAELALTRARHEVELLEREGEERELEAAQLEASAAELASASWLAAETAAPAPGLDGAREWASRARGELLLRRTRLAGERDRVVREATELLAGALGEPLVATSVAGVRDRLARALDDG